MLWALHHLIWLTILQESEPSFSWTNIFSIDLVSSGWVNENGSHICVEGCLMMLLLCSFLDSEHFEILIVWRWWSGMPCYVQTLAGFQFLFQNRVCYCYLWLHGYTCTNAMFTCHAIRVSIDDDCLMMLNIACCLWWTLNLPRNPWIMFCLFLLWYYMNFDAMIFCVYAGNSFYDDACMKRPLPCC